jgi:carboxyl-terminal processing protease
MAGVRLATSVIAAALLSFTALGAVFVSPVPGSASVAVSSSTQAGTQAGTQPATAATPTTLPAQTPQQYLTSALDFIESAALRRGKVDWPLIRATAERGGKDAKQISDVYPLIITALAGLGDRHSSFRPPVKAVEVTQGKVTSYGFLASWPQRIVVSLSSGGPAEVAGLKLGDRIDSVEGRKPQGKNGVLATPTNTKVKDTLRLGITRPAAANSTAKPKKLNLSISKGVVSLAVVPKPIELATGAALGGGRIGYLDLPGLLGTQQDQQAYASAAHAALRQLDATPRCGWVVDVRRNRGGWVYPMLAAIGPLGVELTDSTVGSILVGKVNAQGTTEQWRYANGAISVRRQEAPIAGSPSTTVASAPVEADAFRIPDPYQLKTEIPTVAVLQSALTASAGESVALAFRSRPASRSFGEPTYGLTTFNVPAFLSDGALLIVANAAMTDRRGVAVDGPVAPDEAIVPDWTHFNDEQDPILTKAVAWLLAQPACQ